MTIYLFIMKSYMSTQEYKEKNEQKIELQDHLRSPMSVPLERPYATSY